MLVCHLVQGRWGRRSHLPLAWAADHRRLGRARRRRSCGVNAFGHKFGGGEITNFAGELDLVVAQLPV